MLMAIIKQLFIKVGWRCSGEAYNNELITEELLLHSFQVARIFLFHTRYYSPQDGAGLQTPSSGTSVLFPRSQKMSKLKSSPQ